MTLDPSWIIGLSVLIVIGNYSLFQSRLEGSFVTRYKRFRKHFELWMEKDTNNFYRKLQQKLKTKSNPDELAQFVSLWSSRRTAVDRISGHYDNLGFRFNCICFCLALATFLSIGALVYPNPIFTINPETFPRLELKNPLLIHFIDVSILWFIIGLLFTFSYIIGMHGLSSRITKFELEASMEKVMEAELRVYGRTENQEQH